MALNARTLAVRPALEPVGRIVALIASNVTMVLIAMTMVMFTHDLYPWYASRGLAAQESDQQIAGAILSHGERRIRRRQCVKDIAEGTAPEHHRPLEHDGALVRRRRFAAAPGDASARGGNKSHGCAQQSGLAGAIGSDQNSGRASFERERNIVEDRHLAGEDSHFYEH